MCVMSVTLMTSTRDQSEEPIKETLQKKCDTDLHKKEPTKAICA